MGAHPHLRCVIEGAIRVMVGFVDLVEERRSDGSPLGADAVARRATAVEEGLSFAEVGGRLDGWRIGGRRVGYGQTQGECHCGREQHQCPFFSICVRASFAASVATHKRYWLRGLGLFSALGLSYRQRST